MLWSAQDTNGFSRSVFFFAFKNFVNEKERRTNSPFLEQIIPENLTSQLEIIMFELISKCVSDEFLIK